jgi:hypothetical protein
VTWPGNAACLSFAIDALSKPPAKPHIVRPEPAGELVWECVVPGVYCQPGNIQSRTHWSVYHKAKKRCLGHMRGQLLGRRRTEALPGRPCVHVVRFTSVRPDKRSNWDKAPVDCLTGKHGGLGFLRDDCEEDVDLHAWWEPGKEKQGFVLVRVYAGEQEKRSG